MIAHKLKAIFIHIAKTAGSSIEVALDAVEKTNEGSTDPATGDFVPVVTGDEKHLTAKDTRALVGEDVWNSYYKFTIVRNPFDRLHSLWWNSRYMGKHHEFELPEFAEYYLEQSLMGKIRGLLAGRRRMHERFWPQYEFVVSANGKMEMDYVIRFENINEDFAVVADRLGLPSLEAPKILHKNRNPKSRRSYVEDYNDRARDFVSEVYRDDIREFGYTFGE